MRAFEFNKSYRVKLLNDLLTADRRSIGLICSFKGHVPLGESGLFYDFDEIRDKTKELCDSLNVDFHIVGTNQNSLDWMDEVYKVILESHVVIVDVSDPRPNVLYELGVACSLRPSESVVITKHVSSNFVSSEVEQLQIMTYDCLHDLGEKIIQHFKRLSWPLDKELDETFSTLHNQLNPMVMTFLNETRVRHNETGKWHCNFNREDAYRYASKLVDIGLAKYEYDSGEEENAFEWALHPTEMGKKYMESKHFQKFFYKKNP